MIQTACSSTALTRATRRKREAETGHPQGAIRGRQDKKEKNMADCQPCCVRQARRTWRPLKEPGWLIVCFFLVLPQFSLSSFSETIRLEQFHTVAVRDRVRLETVCFNGLCRSTWASITILTIQNASGSLPSGPQNWPPQAFLYEER